MRQYSCMSGEEVTEVTGVKEVTGAMRVVWVSRGTRLRKARLYLI